MSSAEDLALLATRAAANRAALSARILQHLEPHGESSSSGASGSTAASSKSAALPKPRPPTLGLGMALPSAAAPSAGASADARLRGTLTGGAAARSRKREREAERVELVPAEPTEAQQQQALALEAEESRSGRQEKKRKGLDPFSAKGKKKSAAVPAPAAQQAQAPEADVSGAKAALDPSSEAGRKAIYALAEKKAIQAGQELAQGASKKAVKKARKARRQQVLAEHGLAEPGQAKSEGMLVNGQANGQANGQTNDQPNGQANGESAASATQAAPKAKKAKKAAAAASASNGASRALPAFPALPALHTSLPEKLLGSRFRTINEALYTTSGADALAETTQEAERMAAYHAGFRAQTKSWPLVPVQAIARILLSSASGAQGGRGMSAQQPLVLDLGAGEAPLARILAREEPARWKVLSFDLDNSADGWVRRVNCAGELPLPGVSPWQDETPALEMQIVDVVVFCLALMGTDWVRMISEAQRVLRTGGDLLISEVSSRHDSIDAFVEVICALGFENLTQDSSNTHFSLFHFRKTALDRGRVARLVAGDDEGEAQLESLIAMGPQVLKPCLYKRR